ncbi:MAG: hypothetical protein HYW47_07565 [Deltaproteobacteria bacterium]|nr:hypothetical protein [Deltaproteobacteria bacterium]
MKIVLSPLYEFIPSEDERSHIEKLASSFLERSHIQDLKKRYIPYQVTDTQSDTPSLVVCDFSGIPFLDNIIGVEFYQYRLRVLAGSSDIICGTFPLDPALEDYDEKYLGIGRPTYVPIEEKKYHNFLIAKKISSHQHSLDKLAKEVKKKKIEYLHPYMGVKDVWEVAIDLSKKVGRKIKVFAPPPYVCKWANDKAFFTYFVRKILGSNEVPQAKWANHLEAIVDCLKVLIPQFPKVALKIADYASAMGNIVYRSENLKALSDEELKEKIYLDLARHDWTDGDTVCAVQWRENVLTSPSAQVWIPHPREGYPIIEGIFEQFLQGETKIFQGSRPSTLPSRLNDLIAKKTFLMALFFQYLGYVGRCSFDLIVCGDSYDQCEIQLVECNGRWGGTSLPMSFMNRLFGNHHKLSYKAIDVIHPKLKGLSFKKFLSIFRREELYQPHNQKGHFLFYNTACMKPVAKCDVIALGSSFKEAEKRADHDLIELIEKSL